MQEKGKIARIGRLFELGSVLLYVSTRFGSDADTNEHYCYLLDNIL